MGDRLDEERKPCGCACGCHNRHHTGIPDGCRNEAEWLPEHKVWACKECLVTCDD